MLAREVIASGMERQVIVYAGPEVIAAVREASRNTVPVMTKWRPGMAPPAEFVPAAHGEHPLEDVAPELLREVPGAHAVAPPGAPTYPVPMQ